MNVSRPTIFAAVISLGILAVYLSLPTRNYYWDGIGFAQAIEDSPRLSAALIHPNHLIYTAAGYLDYRLIGALGFRHARALTALRVTNSILSAAAAFLLFELLMSSFGSVYLSSALTVVFSFSATWWKFSTDANAYVPAVLLLLLSFRLLLPGRDSRPVAVGLAHTAAILLHQLAVLFYPVAVLGLLQQRPDLSLRRRLIAVAEYSAVAFSLTVAAYYAGQRASNQSGGIAHRRFLAWITSYSPDASFSWNVARDTWLSLRGHLRLFLGGRVSWAIRQWPYFSIVMTLIIVLILSVLAFRLINYRRLVKSSVALSAGPRYSDLLSLVSVWIACYVVFLFFWLPGNTFYRLFYLPALVLLVGAWIGRGYAARGEGRPKVYAAALLAAMMVISNLTFDIFPNSRVQSNPPLQFALGMALVWGPGTVVYYGAFNTDDWTIRYFHPETSWVKWEPATLPSLEAELRRRDQSTAGVWLDTTALDILHSTPVGLQWLAEHTPGKVRAELVDDRHRIIFQKIGLR